MDGDDTLLDKAITGCMIVLGLAVFIGFSIAMICAGCFGG